MFGAARMPDLRLLRHPSSWTLRSKLVASMLALFVIVTVAVGAATVIELDKSLMSQLDDRLTATATAGFGGGGGAAGGGAFGRLQDRSIGPGIEPTMVPRGAGAGFLRVTTVEGTVTNTVLVGLNSIQTLSMAQLSQLTSARLTQHPSSLDLASLGTYRLVRVAHDYDEVTITGLPVAGVQKTVRGLGYFIALLTAAGLVLVVLGGTWLVRASLRPLRRVAATATRVSHLPLDSGAVALAERVPSADTDPRTEVGQVGVALNGLLDHVGAALNARHESEMRVRQFVADASHELRTPLASIRGYAELSRKEREPVPATVTHALARVESEATRMSLLVDDLLLLARLDAGRPLDREPVDLTHLVVDAVSDAHAASPAHVWRLDVPEDSVMVEGDSARLHQVVANLLANARTHTPDGTTVLATVHRDGQHAMVSVEDDGPGVPAALQANVFHRFARGDSSRSRAAGSTGLGLSIVSAVASAHGGRVSLESRPGRTRFSVELPVS